MTKTPYQSSNRSENPNSPDRRQQARAQSARIQKPGSALVTTEEAISVEVEVQPTTRLAPEQRLGLKAKTISLARELSVLRSSIDARVNQLQVLIQQEGAAAERAELVNEITSHMREFLNPEGIYKTAVEDCRAALQTDRVVIYLFDPHWKGTVVAESVSPEWPSALGAEIADPCFADRYVEFYQQGRVKATANIYAAGLTDCHIGQLEPFEVQANLVAPILTNTHSSPIAQTTQAETSITTEGSAGLIGLLIAHHCAEPREWLEPEIEFFRQVAIQLGYAIDQALLLQQQQAIARQAQQINEISTQIRQSFKVDAILSTTVEATRQALNCDRTIVYTFDQNWKGTVVAESVENPWPVAMGAEIADPCFAERYVQQYLRGRVKATPDIHNAGLTECHLKQLEPFSVRANLVAPIVVNQHLMGLLISHQCSGPRNWTELEIDLIRKVATQTGYALDQAHLLEAQALATRKAHLLNQASAKLRDSRTTEDVFDTIVHEAREAMQCDRVIIYQFDENWIGTVVAESVSSGFPSALGKKIADPCFAGQCVKPYFRGRVSTMDNIAESGLTDCYRQLLDPFKVQANIVAPLIAETRLHGLLIVHQCSGPRHWQEAEVNFIKQLATQVSLSLDQVLLLQQQQQAAKEAQALNQISSHIRQSLNAQDILNTAVEDTQEILQADRVVVYKFNPEWGGAVVAESVGIGFPETLGAQIDDPCFAKDYIKPYLKGRVQATDDIFNAGLTDCYLKQLEPYQVKANLVTPIIANQKLHGLLIAHQCSGPRRWKDTEIELTRQIAIQVGYALEQALLLEQQRLATQQARLLSEIGSRIRESLDTERIFRTAVDESLNLMQADRVVVYRFDQDWRGQIISEAVRSGWNKIAEMDADLACFPVEYVEPYRQGRVQVTPDVSAAELTECHREQLKKWQVRANVVVPIIVGQTLFGLLGVHQCAEPRVWRESEVEIFKQVALQAGYALEQAQLLQQVQQARQLAETTSESQRQQNELLQHQIEGFLGDIEDSFSGDLTVRAKVTEGVIGTVADFFNATIENLQLLVKQVQSAATVVTATAQGSEQDIKQLSDEARRQSQGISDALNQIQMMAQSIQVVAENAQSAASKTQEASQLLRKSDIAMNRTVDGIVGIYRTVHATAHKVKNLGEASKKISRVVNLIGDFANQTNVLALNASVEATRASQDDQGFATVAGEVRTLAEQSAIASQEIEQIVEEIQGETQELVDAMKVGLKQVIVGTKLVKGSRQILTNVVTASEQIQVLVNQIAESATVQAQTSGEISHTMEEVATIANQTSERSLKVADSFSQLLKVAGDLQTGVSQFKA
ncbi:MAG: GAF domain-containing protein [Oscillatoriales cyanobacterium RM2_1_1]|nr:GAF domain-containing protein [Oscillatoriales cyanobacterium RM2_1_1]